MPIEEFILRLLLAVILGVLIGFERQWRQRSAGLRTNTLVSTGSAAFVLLSATLTADSVMGDPSRIAGQIVTGIGFLGAGVIMKDGFTVRGLNTAATIWCSAAVGALAGAGLYLEATVTAIVIVFIHFFLRPFGQLLGRRPYSQTEISSVRYHFEVRCKAEVENQVRVMLMQFINQDDALHLRVLKSIDDESPSKAAILAEIEANGTKDIEMEEAAGRLTVLRGVTHVSWEIKEQDTD